MHESKYLGTAATTTTGSGQILLKGLDPFSVGLSGSEKGKAIPIAPPTFEDQLSAAS